MEIYKGLKVIHAKTRKSWRTWLSKNHTKCRAVWLIFFSKSSEIKAVNYNDAVEEALCFGWIDSVVNKRNEESRYQYFGPRKANSRWSNLNKERIKRLMEAGLMQESGTAAIETAKKTGAWEALDHVHQ